MAFMVTSPNLSNVRQDDFDRDNTLTCKKEIFMIRRWSNHEDRDAGRRNIESGAHLHFDIVLENIPMLL